jgi:hypothetical protein
MEKFLKNEGDRAKFGKGGGQQELKSMRKN